MFFKNLEEDIELWDRQRDDTELLLPSVPTHRSFDYVLVAQKVNEDNNQKAQRQRAFIQQLEKKNITITVSVFK
ncbi:hypothetical protein INR49_002758 [Caranx melampygus]|nr:hypothetical protein INR49_002758 [Caranx melampygus]